MKSSTYFVSMEERKRQRVVLRIKRFLLALIIFNIITMLFIRTYKISSSIMEPSIEQDSILLVSPVVYGPRFFGINLFPVSSPKRGDVIVFLSPFWNKMNPVLDFFNSIIDYVSAGNLHMGESWEGKYQVRRIIGIPGDLIYIKDNIAYIKPRDNTDFIREDLLINYKFKLSDNDKKLYFDDFFSYLNNSIKLQKGQYFVLSDNRNMVMDSRVYGPISFDSIRGKIIWNFKM
ncbi:signal peptidase I [Spirochaetia bacterium 38H-sp]|uniref:Signal peptidase I n=1 Tax=Rarispira pelagica TaxID=3141764 RepID=A0ABU9UC92_9SPIR